MSVTSISPTENDVGGGGLGRAITELLWGQIGYQNHNWVHSGLTSTDGGGLVLNIASGVAWIDGFRVDWAADTITLSASSQCRVWLQLTFDGSSKVDGAQLVETTDTTIKSDAVMLSDVVTGVSTITTILDRRALYPWGFLGPYRTDAGGGWADDVVLGFRPAVLMLARTDANSTGEYWDGFTRSPTIIVLEGTPSGVITFQNYGFTVGGASTWDTQYGWVKALYGSHV